mmetsp:Transcript_105219/g.322535  ORF Transcript_105219/g.322535 Transcript_105219/m.322535 type:complete len:233 (+) Transcript_105219:122-820(+)
MPSSWLIRCAAIESFSNNSGFFFSPCSSSLPPTSSWACNLAIRASTTSGGFVTTPVIAPAMAPQMKGCKVKGTPYWISSSRSLNNSYSVHCKAPKGTPRMQTKTQAACRDWTTLSGGGSKNTFRMASSSFFASPVCSCRLRISKGARIQEPDKYPKTPAGIITANFRFGLLASMNGSKQNWRVSKLKQAMYKPMLGASRKRLKGSPSSKPMGPFGGNSGRPDWMRAFSESNG